jgi:hypothetical protein
MRAISLARMLVVQLQPEQISAVLVHVVRHVLVYATEKVQHLTLLDAAREDKLPRVADRWDRLANEIRKV